MLILKSTCDLQKFDFSRVLTLIYDIFGIVAAVHFFLENLNIKFKFNVTTKK
jgi:hypothetical protein